jgi:hypothetical protein
MPARHDSRVGSSLVDRKRLRYNRITPKLGGSEKHSFEIAGGVNTILTKAREDEEVSGV